MALWNWNDSTRWSFVIDTDTYAGNFERELCSFVVGHHDEYGDHRGGVYKAAFREQYADKDPFEGLIDYRVDDHGDDNIARAPMALAPTPGYENNGLGGVRKLEPGEIPNYPSYQSVAIFLCAKPTDEQLKILIERALLFPTLPKNYEWDERPMIIGLRLVEERTTLQSTVLA